MVDGDFAPLTEADVQSELYHLCKLYADKSQSSRIHVGTPYPENRQRTDILLGNSYFIEVKKRESRDWNEYPGWFGDVKKLQEMKELDPKRIPVVAVLFTTKFNEYQRRKLKDYKQEAWRAGVRLIYGNRELHRFWTIGER